MKARLLRISSVGGVLASLFLLAALALPATPAQAAYIHQFGSYFGSFSDPQALTVDQRTGELYVLEGWEAMNPAGTTGTGCVSRFDRNQQPVAFSSPASNRLCGFNFAHNALVPSTGQVAVDESATATAGTIYANTITSSEGQSAVANGIPDYNENAVLEFDRNGALIGKITASGSETFTPCGVATDPQGNVYVATAGPGASQVNVYRHDNPVTSADLVTKIDINKVDVCQLGVDPSGAIYASTAVQTGGELSKYPPGPPSGVVTEQGALIDPTARAFYVDPASGEVYVDEGGNYGNKPTVTSQIAVFDSAGGLKERFGAGYLTNLENDVDTGSLGVAVDHSTGTAYVSNTTGKIAVFTAVVVPDLTIDPHTNPTPTSATLNAHVDPAAGGPVIKCHFEYGTDTSFGSGSLPCLDHEGHVVGTEEAPIESPTAVHADLSSLTTETTYVYRLLAGNAKGTIFANGHLTPHHVVDLATDPATALAPTAAALNGSFLANNQDTHYYFQWGIDTGYGHNAPASSQDAGSPPPGPDRIPLSFRLEGLHSVTTYHYRVVAENEDGTSFGDDQSFTTLPFAPSIKQSVSDVHGDSAILHAHINPGGGDTRYHFEYGTVDCSALPDPCTSVPAPDADIGSATTYQSASTQLHGLAAGTTYHYRVVATNADSPSGGTAGPDRTFTTFPYGPLLNDPCPNAHVRQQTSAAQLPDCRAYELVSAANAGGYDVESNLAPGQAPFGGYPQAAGRLLYGVHDGAVPATANPTNRGLDPYLATRGEAGWSTQYVGVPANDPFSAAPFSSTPSAADANLETFAFGAPGGCSPCFAGGYTGIPLHLPDGKLIQGMAGPENPGPTAKPEGYVAKPLSADGRHLIFASTSLFAPGGNDETGDVSVYDRNLSTGETHLVSNAPAAGPLPCLQGAGNCHSPADANGIAELAISSDGSHILLGQKVSEDSAHNAYWHLYMNVGDSAKTIDLTPGATEGVLFDGITADGSKVFFSSLEHLTGEDEEHSGADIFLWQEGHPLTLISKGNSHSCQPVADSAHLHWNAVGAEEVNCGAVAIGGGGGVSSANGTIYFLSPERLDGSNGTPGAPNLYRAGPADGYAAHYLTTLESALNKPQPPKLKHTFKENLPASFTTATALAVEHSSGDLYVLDSAANAVAKFDSAGNPVQFTAGPGAGTNQLNGSETPAGSFSESFFGFIHPTSLAVDQSSGDLYVPDLEHGVIDKFSPSGTYLSQVHVGLPAGVAVDPSNGNLYVIGVFGAVSIFDSSGKPFSSFEAGGISAAIAVDPAATVYVTYLAGFGTGATEVFNSFGKHLRTLDTTPGQSVAVDTSNSDVYVDEGAAIGRYDSSGKRIETLEKPTGHLSGSGGVAIDPEGNLYATDEAGAKVALFPPSLAPDPLIDNPVVLDSVSEPESRHTADFQLAPNGNDAVFTSTLPFTGYDNAGHSEVYRYDSQSGRLDCASCAPTGAQATGDATLASNGLSLTDDGRVFFTSTDALVPRDLDNKKDVYEWQAQGFEPGFGLPPCQTTGGCLGLISTGISPFDSSLLSASADGTDAYFFTHDRLVPQDENGQLVKVYDARAGGGFLFIPKSAPCQASDECHGPSSQAPPPPSIGTVRGSGGNYAALGKKHHKHHHRHRHHRKLAAGHNRGANR